MLNTTRCGHIALLGAPNAGKSTLLNRLVGSKIAIVTPKAQTTRNRIAGITLQDNAQLIFLDLPGVFEAEKDFEKTLVKTAWAGVKEADEVLLIVDAASHGKHAPAGKNTEAAIERLKKIKGEATLVLNKIDLVKKEKLLELAEAFNKSGLFTRIFMISAATGDGVESLKENLALRMPEGPFLYDRDQMSDMPLRMLAAEVTREKLFLKLQEELPYSLTVLSEMWEERKDGSVKIDQTIYVQRESQKKIVLGEKGAMLKAVGMASRRELETLLERKVHLFLFVKVKPDWKIKKEFYPGLLVE